MKHEPRHKARQRLDERLAPLKPVDRSAVPPRGWIRAIREALGMSGVQFAKRLGVSPQTADHLERSQAAGSMKLDTLRRAAEALDCTLIYALVPNTSLEDSVQNRARAIAEHDLGRVTHTMKPEAQQTGDADLEARIEEYIREHLRLRDLWNRR
jgi:predicted DNA-binding mobile mystery protein A